MPKVEEYFEQGYFDPDLIPQLAELGLLGIKIEGYDCPGMSNVDYGLACQELERGDSGSAFVCFGAKFTGNVPHLRLWYGRAESPLATRHGQG